MTWVNQHDFNEFCDGDKPYGNYWIEAPQRPSPLHVWDGEQWVADRKALHNAPIDESIDAIEQQQPFTQRMFREWLLAELLQAGLPAAFLDPTQIIDATTTAWKSLTFGAKAAVMQERAVRQLRDKRL